MLNYTSYYDSSKIIIFGLIKNKCKPFKNKNFIMIMFS